MTSNSKEYVKILWAIVLNFSPLQLSIFRCYFLKPIYTVHPISQPTSNCIKLSSFRTIYLMGVM